MYLSPDAAPVYLTFLIKVLVSAMASFLAVCGFVGFLKYRQKYHLFGGMSCYLLKPYEATKNPLSNEEGGF